MKSVKISLQALSLYILSWGFAHAIDPAKWVQTQTLPDAVLVNGGTYVASYTFTSQIPITMVRPFLVLKTSNSPSEFRYDDACSGKTLAYLESCTVKIYLDPTSPGQKTVQLTQQYGHDKVPLPQLLSRATGDDPTGMVNGVVTTALPATMTVGTSAPWRFTYTNNSSATATGVVLSVSESSYNTTCTSTLSNVAPGNTCYIQGNYTASSAGAHTVSATYSYAQGNPVQLATTTTGSGASGGLICRAAVPLAPQVLINSSSPVTLLCTNQSGGPINITGHVTNYPMGGANGTFTPGVGGDNCTAQPLANGAACQLQGTYDAPGAPINNISISLSVNYNTSGSTGLNAQVSTTTDVVTTINNSRNINIINNCNFNVWWSMVGGALTNSPACTSDADCPTGSTCNVSGKICYYNNYGPTTGAYLLTANGGTAATQIIETAASNQAGDDILWKGLISGSTQCSGSSCANNDCQSNGGTTSCAPGVGFQQPATEAEFTFMLAGAGNVDTYDITNVNGFSMPMSMATNQAASDYTCGTPGSANASGNLRACNYSGITPPTQMYYWVNLTNTACTAQNTCTDNTKICGLAFNPGTNGFVKNCGSFLGYWAANQICQTQPSFSSPFGDNFNCNQMLSTPFPSNTYTLTQLFKCSPPSSTAPLFNSCYLSYSGYSSTQLQQCCGCTDWAGIANPSEACPIGQTDPQWTSYVLPTIQWMKQACPTSYSYPYDDKASTFQCTSSAATQYTITFCPGNASGGLPSGKTDGR